jgi:hypothetical protein
MQKLLISRVLTEAFVELLEWDDYFGWPETLAMDAHRFTSLRDQLERAAMSTGVILLAFSNISGYVIPAHAQALKITIKNHIDILLQDFNDDTDLLKILPNVGLQVVQDINDYLKANKKDLLPDSTKATLQVNLFKNPLFQKSWIFPAKKSVHFLPFEQKMCYKRTCSLRVFLQIICLNNVNKKLILKRIWREFWIIW